MSKKQKSNYSELLQDPRWQKKRLEIMLRDNFTCQHCGCKDKTLQVHHLWYSSLKKPWEYENDSYLTLCSHCHELETEYNNELYSAFCDLKTIAGQNGFSKQLLESILKRLFYYIASKMDEEDVQEEDSEITRIFYDAICGTQIYSDAKALEKMGVDMSDYFLNVKTPNLNE